MTTQEIERKLAAILSADAQGYSRLNIPPFQYSIIHFLSYAIPQTV